jgi:hypothetical protein
VLIGTNLDRAALTEMLDGALLTPEELAVPEGRWPKLFKDPFPKWKMAVAAY